MAKELVNVYQGQIAKQAARIPTQQEQEMVRDVLQEFSQMTVWRNQHASQWEETAELIDPNSRNTFFYGNFNWPGMKKTQQQVDASGMMALHRFGAICDSMLTPRNMIWHQLRADDDYVMKDRLTRLWFEEATRVLFKHRYQPLANFTGQNQNAYRSLGAYGNTAMFIDRLDGRLYGGARGLRYKSLPLGEIFMRENHQGIIDGFIRWFRLTAYQAVQQFGMEYLPQNLYAPLEQYSQWPYQFLHCVRPRADFDPTRYDQKAMPWSSLYVSIEGQCLMAPEGGYRSFPLAPARYEQAPGEIYGRGPATMVLPALKTLNAEKRTFLKQGHRAADPVLLTGDDGIVDLSMRPGAQNKGGVNPDGKPMVHTLPTGNIQISEKMMEVERNLIDDAFLVSLFRLILEEKVLTATQVTEIVNQKGILIAPTLGRQQSEYLGPMIDRELDELGAQGLLPEMPPRLKEARGQYSVRYTSPIAKLQRAGEVAGFMRSVETSKEIAQITQDPGYLDHYDFDVATPAIADINGVPESWMADQKKVEAKRQARAQAAQRDAQVKALPGQAAIMNAQAHQAKAGMNQPQPGAMPGQGAPA